MVRDFEFGITMVKSEMQERVKGKAAENAEERILDILIPLNSRTWLWQHFLTKWQWPSNIRNATRKHSSSDDELNQRTRSVSVKN